MNHFNNYCSCIAPRFYKDMNLFNEYKKDDDFFLNPLNYLRIERGNEKQLNEALDLLKKSNKDFRILEYEILDEEDERELKNDYYYCCDWCELDEKEEYQNMGNYYSTPIFKKQQPHEDKKNTHESISEKSRFTQDFFVSPICAPINEIFNYGKYYFLGIEKKYFSNSFRLRRICAFHYYKSFSYQYGDLVSFIRDDLRKEIKDNLKQDLILKPLFLGCEELEKREYKRIMDLYNPNFKTLEGDPLTEKIKIYGVEKCYSMIKHFNFKLVLRLMIEEEKKFYFQNDNFLYDNLKNINLKTIKIINHIYFRKNFKKDNYEDYQDYNLSNLIININKIKRLFLKCYYDPRHPIGKRRLNKSYDELFN